MKTIPRGLLVAMVAAILMWGVCMYFGDLQATIVAYPVAIIAGILGGKWDNKHQ